MYKELFGKRLAKARKEAGYTQEKASIKLKIPAGTIANWETNRTEPDIESIGTMIDTYKISADWLIGTGRNRK